MHNTINAINPGVTPTEVPTVNLLSGGFTLTFFGKAKLLVISPKSPPYYGRAVIPNNALRGWGTSCMRSCGGLLLCGLGNNWKQWSGCWHAFLSFCDIFTHVMASVRQLSVVSVLRYRLKKCYERNKSRNSVISQSPMWGPSKSPLWALSLTGKFFRYTGLNVSQRYPVDTET